jgi:hypothetical protein
VNQPPGVPGDTPTGLTGPLRWLAAIAASKLDKMEKLVLALGLGPHLNWHTWECFPSIVLMAKKTGLSRTGFRQVLDRLIENGVVVLRRKSTGGIAPGGRGIPHVYWVDVAKLEAWGNGQPGKGQLGYPLATCKGVTGSPLSSNGVADGTPHPVVRNRPSIHNRPTEQTIHAPSNGMGKPGAWMDAPGPSSSIRRALAGYQIAGPLLEALSRVPGLTVEELEREWRSVNSDSRVRNRPAVLAARLTKRYGISFEKSRERPLSPDLRRLNEHILAQRRRVSEHRQSEHLESRHIEASDGAAGA